MNDRNETVRKIVDIIQLELSITKFRKLEVSEIIEYLEHAENKTYFSRKGDFFLHAYKDTVTFFCNGSSFKINNGLLYEQMLIAFEDEHAEDNMEILLGLIANLFGWNDDMIDKNWVDVNYA